MCPSKKGGLYPKKNTPPENPRNILPPLQGSNSLKPRIPVPGHVQVPQALRKSGCLLPYHSRPRWVYVPYSQLLFLCLWQCSKSLRIVCFSLIFINMLYLRRYNESICIVVKMDSTHWQLFSLLPWFSCRLLVPTPFLTCTPPGLWN